MVKANEDRASHDLHAFVLCSAELDSHTTGMSTRPACSVNWIGRRWSVFTLPTEPANVVTGPGHVLCASVTIGAFVSKYLCKDHARIVHDGLCPTQKGYPLRWRYGCCVP